MCRRCEAATGLLAVWSLALVWGCSLAPGGGGAECAAENEACADDADCCGDLVCVDDTCTTPEVEGTAALPAKSIGFDLIGIHDPDSDSYNDDCIGCHGDRTDEVALDGETPAAHAVMIALFGEGNDRCAACHDGGPNFYDFASGMGSLSAMALREQVDIEATNCTGCHGADTASAFGTVAFYAE